MNLRHLQFFIAVIECRGVSKAAERLRVSQPAVSAALRSLEEDLGQALFDRESGTRRTRPTTQGLRFYEHALEIIRSYEHARQSLSETKGRSPTIRVGVLQTLAAWDVARAHARLVERAPQWRWSLREGTEQEISEWFNRERIDVAWTVVDDSLDLATPLWREPYVVLAARDHRLAQDGGRSVESVDLSAEPIVLRAACELKPGALKAAGLSMKVAARAGRDELALQLVANGAGIAIAPQSLATTDVVALPVKGLGLSRQIGVRWRHTVSDAVIEAALAAWRTV